VLLLVRHGETAPNVDGLLLGRADPPLTARGEHQARQLAAMLPTPDAVITSPLARARATAAAFGGGVVVDERWIELDYGELDGAAPEDVPGTLWERWRTDPTFAPPGGESLVELGSRVDDACGELVRRAAEEVVIVVSHVSPIKAAVAWALGAGPASAWRMYVEDASVSRVDVDGDGRPVLRWFNRAPQPAP
jgi:broad specificity phosphatase PhoE